ncbi:AfsR/SARP family transcriptional regulator [Longispora sp. K20-0274]|uniref:AfsR/SARP family transcriptional regulator n=1 Tax=Longispora sp. K20-0274 TaxID=3088255 RepID=UPI00399C3BF5
MEFRLLGRVELLRDGVVAPLGRGQRTVVLVTLLLAGNRSVPVDRLFDLLWPAGPPRHARTVLHGHLSALRGALGDRLETQPSGYLLRAAPDEVDAFRFRRALDTARAAPDEAAVGTLRAALALWRGPALQGAPDQLAGFAAPWEDARLEATELLGAALVRLGRPGEAVAELSGPAAAHPLRETLIEPLIAALYATGRQADALDLHERTRSALAESLGVDPGPALTALHGTILRAERLPAPGTLRDRGLALAAEGRVEEAAGCFRQLRALGRQLADPDLERAALTNLAAVAIDRGDYRSARRSAVAAVALGHRCRSDADRALALANLAVAEQALGRPGPARGYAAAALRTPTLPTPVAESLRAQLGGR